MNSVQRIETRCRGCGIVLTLPSGRAGARMRCPACRLEMAAPLATDVGALEAVCHFCGAWAPAPLLANDYRVCTLCDESIHENNKSLRLEQEQRDHWRRRLLWLAAIGAVIWLSVVGLADARQVARPSASAPAWAP